jgi:ribA/ribD-fused uncharacterized protein
MVFQWNGVSTDKMAYVLKCKFRDPDLRARLLATADATLVEDSPTDKAWGVGRNGNGQNRLGIALMKIRSDIR